VRPTVTRDGGTKNDEQRVLVKIMGPNLAM